MLRSRSVLQWRCWRLVAPRTSSLRSKQQQGHSLTGVLMLSSPLFGGNPQLLADLALQNRLPAINIYPDFAQKGGLIGYGPELQNLFMQSGVLVRKVLQGNSIADLPIERPTRFRLVANSVTARALGLTLPTSILLGADEVIE